MRLAAHWQWPVYLMVFASAAALGAEATADLPVYKDSLLNGFEDEQWTSLDLADTSVVHSGTCSIRVTPAGLWQGVFFHHLAFDTTPYSSLSLWVHGGTNGGQRLQIQGLTADTNPPPNLYYRFMVQTSAWQQVTVPLADLGIAKESNCTGFWIELTPKGGSNTFYVDDVRLVADPAAAAEFHPASLAPDPDPWRHWSTAVWCVVAVLGVMTVLLIWLVLMVRRSSLASSRALVPFSGRAGLQLGRPEGAGFVDLPPEVEAFADAQAHRLREKVASELAEFAKQSLIQGLYSQRNKLIETQQQAQDELSALESRLASLQLPLQERIQAYELRIRELQTQLDTRDDEMQGMIQATLLLVRERLEQEKAKENLPGRFN